MAIKRLKLACDFETTVIPEDLRVWASCAVDIDTLETLHKGTSIEEFFEFLKDKNTVCYFHNEKFDGEFVVSWLLLNGFKYSHSKEDKTFSVLISDVGQWYSITVIFEKKNKTYKKAVMYDSLKKLPFKVSRIAKAFNLPIAKGEIDYKMHRPKGYQPTAHEWDYIETDCKIVASALKIQFEQGLKKMTVGSDALKGFKTVISDRQFDYMFPVLPLELDTDIRRAYKGGFVYLNPKHKNARGLQGKAYDVNSLYPWVMYECVLPYGYPMYFEGEPNPDELYNLFIVRLECAFDLKPNHLPTIQLKNNRAFVETEYLTTSNGDIVEMTLTSVDLALFLEHYDVSCLTYKNGWKFKGKAGIFKEYIDYWMYIKETTTGALRQLAKLMLNSLYGKFATNPKSASKIPILDENGVVHYVINNKKNRELYNLHHIPEDEDRDPVYTAMGCFITAYARDKTIRSGQTLYDRFIYADTDSLKLVGIEEPETLDVHPTKLGCWKDEGTFTDSKWIRAKTYMTTTEDGTSVTCAGMPDNIKAQVTYENFCSGSTFNGKLVPKRYKGGVILTETTFTIK